MQIINTKLLSHPLNYVTVGLMLVFAATAGQLVMKLFDKSPSTASTNGQSVYGGISAGPASLSAS